MRTVENIKSESLIAVIASAVDPMATAKTDGGKGYKTSQMPVVKHIKLTITGKQSSNIYSGSIL
jgi:hypothetical protein